MLMHNVFFTLKDPSAAARQQLLASCRKHLTGHPGTVSFSCGTLVEDLTREVNDRDFHVALHILFADRTAHDQYQVSPRHVQFIEENRPTWAKVRVFDSDVEER